MSLLAHKGNMSFVLIIRVLFGDMSFILLTMNRLGQMKTKRRKKRKQLAIKKKNQKPQNTFKTP